MFCMVKTMLYGWRIEMKRHLQIFAGRNLLRAENCRLRIDSLRVENCRLRIAFCNYVYQPPHFKVVTEYAFRINAVTTVTTCNYLFLRILPCIQVYISTTLIYYRVCYPYISSLIPL